MIEIIAAIAGGLIGGLFTFFSVKITLSYQKKHDKEVFSFQNQTIKMTAIENRPRLKISKFEDLSVFNNEFLDINAIIAVIKEYDYSSRKFLYDENLKNKNTWKSICYFLTNDGISEIDGLALSTNLTKQTSLFEFFPESDFSCAHAINCATVYNKPLQRGETISIKLCFVNEPIHTSHETPLIEIWLKDKKGFWWKQGLYVPKNEISDSYESSYEEYSSMTNERNIIQCFRNSSLW